MTTGKNIAVTTECGCVVAIEIGKVEITSPHSEGTNGEERDAELIEMGRKQGISQAYDALVTTLIHDNLQMSITQAQECADAYLSDVMP